MTQSTTSFRRSGQKPVDTTIPINMQGLEQICKTVSIGRSGHKLTDPIIPHYMQDQKLMVKQQYNWKVRKKNVLPEPCQLIDVPDKYHRWATFSIHYYSRLSDIPLIPTMYIDEQRDQPIVGNNGH